MQQQQGHGGCWGLARIEPSRGGGAVAMVVVVRVWGDKVIAALDEVVSPSDLVGRHPA